AGAGRRVYWLVDRGHNCPRSPKPRGGRRARGQAAKRREQGGLFRPQACYAGPMVDLAHRLAGLLGPWFLQHQRDLAWRRTRDPYAIWVSEIMLQQTRVDTVGAYYGRFLARFPDVGTLAAADESEVLAAWSGLGYYRRARLLHAGAK